MVAAAGGLAVLTALDAVTPLSLLGFTFALGLGAAFNYPAWQAIQPELVPKEEFTQAVTLGGANNNLGRAIGPAVGGLLIAAAGLWLVFALNAVSFGFVLLVLWRWRRPVRRMSHRPSASPGRSAPAFATRCSRTCCTVSWCAPSPSARPAPAWSRCCPCTPRRCSGSAPAAWARCMRGSAAGPS